MPTSITPQPESSTEARLLYVTTKDVTQAREIARTLLDERLIACANLMPQMESIYRWEEKVQTDSECVLILKTVRDQVANVTARVIELHTYETPCVLTLNVEGGSEKYLEWLITSSR